MLILASQSPRRKELIKKIEPNFIVIPSDFDEELVHLPAHELPAELSRQKALSIFKDHPEDKVLACDTIVVLGDEVLGKPHTKEIAFKMLKELSGKKHTVISGWTLMTKEKTVTRTVETEVYFNELSDELINAYIETGSPMDKAGAYGIQDEVFHLVSHIVGSMDNVIGLPTEDIKEHWF